MNKINVHNEIRVSAYYENFEDPRDWEHLCKYPPIENEW